MIFYLHIPKTGGQTLGTRIASAFPHQRAMTMLRDFSYPADAEHMESIGEQFDFVEGHVSGPLFQQDHGFAFLCTVRNPIEAIISSYHHIRREPRSMLYRPATELQPEEFFAHFGDEHLNYQASALIGAFFPGTSPDLLAADDARAHQWMYDACGRIRWLVPTEMIDDFTLLWQIETGRRIANASATLNVAGPSPEDERLRLILSRRLDLFSLDTDLWLTARKRYQDWRENVLTSKGGLPPWSDSRVVFEDGPASLRLLDGWYDPERRTDGTWQHWAGPTRASRIAFQKPQGPAILTMTVVNFFGLRPDEVQFRDSFEQPLAVNREDAGALSHYRIHMPDATDGIITVIVPDVRSAMQVSATSKDFARKSIATEGWSIKPA